MGLMSQRYKINQHPANRHESNLHMSVKLCSFVTMLQLTANTIKRIAGLNDRKGRRRENAFKAEGSKCVLDTLPHFILISLYATRDWIESHEEVAFRYGEKLVEVSRSDLRKISSLTTPSDVVAVYQIPIRDYSPHDAKDSLILALDTIQDPGNLGTIIRVADWFGVTDIIASHETADCYSPKVIQSTMGAISRVRIHYCNLPETIRAIGDGNVYGTFLDGSPIGEAKLATTGVIVIGNEGNGISPEIGELVNQRLLIPSFPPGHPTSESLNAAVATAITLAKFRGI